MNTSTQPPDGAGGSKARSKARRADTRPDGCTPVLWMSTLTVGAGLPAMTASQPTHHHQIRLNPLWRGSLLPLGGEAAPKSEPPISLHTRVARYWACCASQREQAPSPQGSIQHRSTTAPCAFAYTSARIRRLVGLGAGLYRDPVAANQRSGFAARISLDSQRPSFVIRRIPLPGSSRYGGCMWEVFGPAGF